MIKRLLLLSALLASFAPLSASAIATPATSPLASGQALTAMPASLPVVTPPAMTSPTITPTPVISSPMSSTVAPTATATTGVLTLNVDHGVPLTLSGPASSVFIANPDIADVQVMSPTSIMIFGKRTGETTFMATDANGNPLAQRTVVVSQDLYPLRSELNAAIPGNKIRVEPLPNGLVLTGEAKDPASVADAYKIAMRYVATGGDIVNRIHVVGSNQILIRVRFAEVQRNINNTLGFNWSDLTSIGGFTFGVATGAISAIAGGANIASAANRPSNTSLSAPNDIIGASGRGSHYNVNAVIDALAQDGLITILAEPNLTAMSGETANFLAGGEFPIPIPQGNNQISIQFKDYGISLEFTPTLISDDRISLHVKPEVSELTDVGAIILDSITVPALTTRKAETTVEVASGQSFAIAGLLDNEQAQTVNKYPVLGDLPILGPLFRSSQFQNGQTELVVIITPYVVKPTGEQLASPTDGLAPPNETERLLGLRYDSSDPDKRTMSGPLTGKHVEPPSASAIIPVPMMPQSALLPSDYKDDAQQAPAPIAAASPPVITSPTLATAPTADTTAPAMPVAETPVSSIAPSAAPTAAIVAPAADTTSMATAPPATAHAVKVSAKTAAKKPAADTLATLNGPTTPAPIRESHDNPTNLLPAGPGGFVVE